MPYSVEVTFKPLCPNCGSELGCPATKSRDPIHPIHRDNPMERKDREVFVEACPKCYNYVGHLKDVQPATDLQPYSNETATITDPFELGVASGKAGLEEHDNPYFGGKDEGTTEQKLRWEEGRQQGELEHPGRLLSLCAEALGILSGHDHHVNLIHRYGGNPWPKIGRIRKAAASHPLTNSPTKKSSN
jgi:hypothetical protein